MGTSNRTAESLPKRSSQVKGMESTINPTCQPKKERQLPQDATMITNASVARSSNDRTVDLGLLVIICAMTLACSRS